MTYKNMSPNVEDQFLKRLDEHIAKFNLPRFHISLHGGEPLLFPKSRFSSLCKRLLGIGTDRNCAVEISVNTNGTLIDDEWCSIFKEHVHHVGVSIDGPKSVHDEYRVDLKGRGTYERVIRGVQILQRNEIQYGVLCVANPNSNPDEILDLFVNELSLKSFDILIPDATHDSPPTGSIAEFYIKLFDAYVTKLAFQGIKIRIIRELVRTCLGFSSQTQSVGRGHIRTIMIKHDGKIEPLDTLHNLGDLYKPGSLNVFDNEINEIIDDPLWRTVYTESAKIPEQCTECPHVRFCGGGNVVERWSAARGFANKSVYCDDLMRIYDHITAYLADQLT